MNAFELPADSRLAGLGLRVRDREAMLAHYRDLLGLTVVEDARERVVLAPGEEGFELSLEIDPEAPLAPIPSVGLYHLALLVPGREELARIVEHLVTQDHRIQGAADHGVSEAVYLADPEGNGIEIYRDRSPEAWPRQGEEVAMVTDPLDLQRLVDESPGPAPLAPGTRLGHVHLHVADLERARAFHMDLGLRVTQSTYPGVVFLAAGAYHHHVGVNAWALDRRAPPGSTGLVSYTWQVPSGTLATLHEALDRPHTFEPEHHRLTLQDPTGAQVIVEEERTGGGTDPGSEPGSEPGG